MEKKTGGGKKVCPIQRNRVWMSFPEPREGVGCQPAEDNLGGQKKGWVV